MEHVSISEPDDDDGVVVLTVDRPPANAMDVTLLREIVEAIEQIAGEPPRALVLAGRPGCFSAGADLKAVPTYGPAQQREMVVGHQRDGAGRVRAGVPGRRRDHRSCDRRRPRARAVQRHPRRLQPPDATG